MNNNTKTARNKAVIYARYSSHNQTEQSIEGQLHDAYDFAQRENLVVIGEYIDRAISGTKDDRPDFQRMIRDAEKRQFDIVLVWKLDRFARNRYDSAVYKAKLKKSGVRVLSVMERITDTPEGIILEGLLEAMAEYYSANLSENIKRGIAETRRKGFFVGGPVPYGYRLKDRKLVKNPDTAPVLQEIYTRFADGQRLSIIASDLIARGIRAPRQAVWDYSSFNAMLPNPVYLGTEYAEQLIDQETYDRVLLHRSQNRQAPQVYKAPVRYLLQPVCRCGECGGVITGDSGKGRHGGVYHYYSCAAKKRQHTCKLRSTRQDQLEPYVIRSTMEYILDPDHIQDIAQLVYDEYNREFDDSQIKELDQQIARLNRELDSLVDSLIEMPASARPRIGQRMEELETRKADLEKDRASLQLTIGIRLSKKDIAGWLQTFASGDPEDPDFCQRLVDTFINSVWIYNDKIVVFYNIKNPNTHTLECSDMKVNGGALPCVSEPIYVFVHGMLGLILDKP